MKIVIDLPEDTYDIVEIKEQLSSVTPKAEPCEDAISRQAAIYVASGFCHPANIADELAKLPPVTPKQRTGHWIEYTRVLIPEPINKWEQAWYCSECGYGNQECEDGSAWLEWNYCPNCGCRMVEPQESEDKA